MYENNFEQQEQKIMGEDETEKGAVKESFFKRHGFVLGILTGLCCVVIAGVLLLGYIKKTGNLLVLGENGAATVKGGTVLTDEIVDKLEELYTYMNLYYYEDIDEEAMPEVFYGALLDSLKDPYSLYYNAEEYQKLMESTSGTYCGIGAGVTQNLETMEVTITKIYKGTPSEEAGLLEGDVILYVDDLEAVTVSADELVQHIRGEEGTAVHMTVYRPSTEETLEIDVIRRMVELTSVEGEMLEDGIAYIQIVEFQSKTDEQFEAMVEEFKKQGMKGLIVDVRSNPGGLLSSVVNMLDYLLPEGMLVYIEDKYGNREEYTSDTACLDVPMVVLTNQNSASASEIFAGALKDYEYATLVGTTTYGKGIVQNVIPLEDGDAIKLTIAKYFTPKGNYIHEVGIEPDVEAEYEYTGNPEEAYDKQYDSQFIKAMEEMEKLLNE